MGSKLVIGSRRSLFAAAAGGEGLRASGRRLTSGSAERRCRIRRPALGSGGVPGTSTELMAGTSERLVDRWPLLGRQLRDALVAEGEDALVPQVEALHVVAECGCGDDFCQSFYTAPKPDGAYGPGHRNVLLDPPWSGMLILDVVDGQIAYVEVLDRDPLD